MTGFPSSVDAFVFDCDGLLVDSEPHWHAAQRELYRSRGLPPSPPLSASLGGSVASVCAAVSVLSGDRVDTVEAEFVAGVCARIVGDTKARPGAAGFVALASSVRPVMVASNSPRAILDRTLVEGGFAPLVGRSVAADEVPAPKPSPDLYLTACARLGVPPSRAVAFEDSPTGVAAARAAGLFVVGVPSLAGADLAADVVLESLGDEGLLAWASALGGPA